MSAQALMFVAIGIYVLGYVMGFLHGRWDRDMSDT